jgi:hypothetical protein
LFNKPVNQGIQLSQIFKEKGLQEATQEKKWQEAIMSICKVIKKYKINKQPNEEVSEAFG